MGPALHVGWFGPHVDQRGEYGIPQLPWIPPTEFQLLQQQHATWGLPSRDLAIAIFAHCFSPLYRIGCCHVLFLTFFFTSKQVPCTYLSLCYSLFLHFYFGRMMSEYSDIFRCYSFERVYLGATCGGGSIARAVPKHGPGQNVISHELLWAMSAPTNQSLI